MTCSFSNSISKSPIFTIRFVATLYIWRSRDSNLGLPPSCRSYSQCLRLSPTSSGSAQDGMEHSKCTFLQHMINVVRSTASSFSSFHTWIREQVPEFAGPYSRPISYPMKHSMHLLIPMTAILVSHSGHLTSRTPFVTLS